jgi:GntR family transcriptional regulator
MPRQPAKAQRLADVLAQQIREGDLVEGTWLPSWVKLAKEHDVVVSTVRRALAMLADQGLIEIVAGRGAIVRKREGVARQAADITQQVGAWRGFHVSAEASGATPFTQTTIRDLAVPAALARWLGVPVGTTVLERDRIQGVVENDQQRPVQISTSWIIPAIVAEIPVLRRVDTGPGGMGSRLAERGYNLRYEDTVGARLPHESEQQRLGIHPEQPVLVVWRRCYDQSDRIVEVTRRVVNAARHELVYRYA